MKAYFGASDGQVLNAVNIAESQPQVITPAQMTPDEQRRAIMVAYIISQTLRGSCLQMLTSVENLSGLKAWRLLVRREESCQGVGSGGSDHEHIAAHLFLGNAGSSLKCWRLSRRPCSATSFITTR